MTRGSRSFNRGRSTLRPQPKTLILCEDSVSFPGYIAAAAEYFRSFASVEIDHCDKTDPLGIVRNAASRKKAFDQVYCAIDRDTHHNFDDAIRLATLEGIELIPSFPCYEFWILLHFRRTRHSYVATGSGSASEHLIRDIRKEIGMGQYSKGKPEGLFRQLLSNLPSARRWSVEILNEAHADGEMNPSTKIHVLIDHLEFLGTPQKIDNGGL